MIRVLCLGRFADELPGGTQTLVDNIFRGFEHDEDFEFVNVVPARRLRSDKLLRFGVTTYRCAGFNVGKSVSVSLMMLWRVFQLHRKRKFDLIHLHYPDPMSHLASLVISSKVPRIISWHSDIVRQKRLLFFYGPFLRLSLRKASAILLATPQHYGSSPTLRKALPDNDPLFKIVPYGIETSSLLVPNPLSAKLRELAAGKVIVFALGRHVYYKGFDTLIQACAAISDKVFLMLGGAGPLTEDYRALIKKLNTQDSVFLAGKIPDQELGAYYQACDIFCLPSTHTSEAFGIVQVEAMSCEKAVVSTRLGNGVEFVNQHDVTGLTVEPGSVTLLRDALLSLAESPTLRANFGQNGVSRANKEFSVEVMYRRLRKVFQQASQDARGPSKEITR